MIVAGGGPAGSACAITAARAGGRVLLLEKELFPRHKVCGEFVSSESLGLLGSLLGEDPFPGQPKIGASRIFFDGKTISLPIAPVARSIPRYDLDAALLEAARASDVRVLESATVQKIEPTGSGTFIFHTRERNVTARTAVNATGRWSQLTAARSPLKEKWIGLKGHYREEASAPSVDLYFFSGGYCGVQPVSDKAVNAAAMVRADAASSMEQVLASHPDLCRRSRSWKPVFCPIATSPLYFRAPLTEDHGTMLVGDAAAFIDPFAGDGISLALHSGRLAAESLAGVWQGTIKSEDAHRRYRTEYQKRFAPAFRNAARLRMFLSAPVWIRSLLLGLMDMAPVATLIVRRTRARQSQDRD